MASSLQDKVVLITGGARGQGAVEGALFADEGATVVLTDVLDDQGEKTAAEIGCEYQHHDVADEAQWQSIVNGVVERHGKIDVLVNNAGIFTTDRLATTELDAFNRMLSINAGGVFLGMKTVAPTMIKQGSGSIVNISSIAGLMGTPASFSYGASKWAVTGMTKSASKDLGRHGIRVNSVHPGYIDTAMLHQAHDFDEESDRTKRMLRAVPLGRVAEPDEVARVVLFLASDASSYCTGQEFTVDGGLV